MQRSAISSCDRQRGALGLILGLAVGLSAAPALAGLVEARDVPLDASIVVMGEQHDAPAHHLNQAAWIERLAPKAVVFEMLPADLAARVPGLLDLRGPEIGAALRWEDRGWPDFSIYLPVFQAIPREATVLGAELSREALTAAEEAVAADAGSAGADDPFGLGTDLPAAEQAARERDLIAAHCGLLPDDAAAGMVEAQRLRDAALAGAALAAFDATGGPVAVVTGNGHARVDRGVPGLLARARPEVTVVSIGQVTEPVAAAPYDAWVVAEAPDDRDEDPCAALR